MTEPSTDEVKEYRRVSRLLESEDPALGDDERLELARLLTQLAPKQPDSWWSVATQIDWMLQDLTGRELREHPLFPELIAAWNRAIAVDSADAAAPYNMAVALYHAGLLNQAYDAYMLAGRTEVAHPTTDLDWPADWHFEDAAEVALAIGDDGLAVAAANAAIEAGAEDRDARSLLNRMRKEASDRPT